MEPFAIFEPSSAGNWPAPLPVGWWQTAQFDVNLLAARHQFVLRVRLERIVLAGGHLLLCPSTHFA